MGHTFNHSSPEFFEACGFTFYDHIEFLKKLVKDFTQDGAGKRSEFVERITRWIESGEVEPALLALSIASYFTALVDTDNEGVDAMHATHVLLVAKELAAKGKIKLEHIGLDPKTDICSRCKDPIVKGADSKWGVCKSCGDTICETCALGFNGDGECAKCAAN